MTLIINNIYYKHFCRKAVLKLIKILASQTFDRINFASTKSRFPYPDFLDVQLKSFQDFSNWKQTLKIVLMRAYIKFLVITFQLLMQETISFLNF